MRRRYPSRFAEPLFSILQYYLQKHVKSSSKMTSLAYNSHSHSHSHSHRYSSNRNHHGLHRPPHLLMTTAAATTATTTTATVMHPCSPAGGTATVRRRPFVSTNLCISTLIISSLTSWLFLSVAFLSGQEEQQRRHRGSRLLQSSPASSAVASWEDLDTHQYSYTQYLIDFPGKIISSREEFVRRREIFEENLAFIYHFNQHKRGYSLGVNDFLDRFPEELPQPGYDKQQHEAWNGRTSDAGLGTEQTHTRMVQTSSEYQVSTRFVVGH